MIFAHHINRAIGRQIILVTISANTYNVNLYTLIGSPGSRVDVLCTVASGVKIGSTSTSTAALATGSFISGSTIRLANHGRIAGKGGLGATSGDSGPGGPAIELSCDIIIDNADGEIFGGGGGGGKGANWSKSSYYGLKLVWGGPGGGGQGIDGGAKGTGGLEGSVDGVGDGSFSTDGGDGSEAGPGGGGFGSGSQAGNGGNGGVWGSSGADGGKNNYGNGGGAGGAGGRAVKLNGHAVTWVAGNNSTHVKGAVS